MIQILVCDKVYVTPEMRRKKVLYKIYFILSVLLVISLFTYYIYAEYDRNKSEQVSQEILKELDIAVDTTDNDNTESSRVTVEDDVIVVILNDDSEEIVNIDKLVEESHAKMEENEANNLGAIPKLYVAKDGTEYYAVGIITIPKIGIEYPILSTWSDALLDNAPCRYDGPKNPNEVGNFVIIGHNYRNEQANKFFTNIHKLEVLDTILITDMSNKTVEYAVYDKEVIEDDDFSCTNQNTNGKKEITLITCHDLGKRRIAIKAVEVE